MTLLELIGFILLIYAVYVVLRPLQKKLETKLKTLMETWGKHE